MSKEKSLVEKKLRGSGGYAIAEVSDDEQKMANLGGPELFLAGIGKLNNDRFKKYYCNKCEKEYQGAPKIEFENPNEDLGENIILIEKGEYKCNTCNYVIAQYRKFKEIKNEEEKQQESNNSNKVFSKDQARQEEERNSNSIIKEIEEEEDNGIKEQENLNGISQSKESQLRTSMNISLDTESSYVHIEKIVGMSTYDHNAHLLGKVNEIGLRMKADGKVEFCFKVKDSDDSISEISWNNISKIGDIIILADKNVSSNEKSDLTSSNTNSISSGQADLSNSEGKICANCNFKNEVESVFCEECGKKLE
jgi:sporulation protein YlmC with PRC-barrel domain